MVHMSQESQYQSLLLVLVRGCPAVAIMTLLISLECPFDSSLGATLLALLKYCFPEIGVVLEGNSLMGGVFTAKGIFLLPSSYGLAHKHFRTKSYTSWAFRNRGFRVL